MILTCLVYLFHEKMSDSGSLSKAAKKNQKRAEKKAEQRAQKLKEEGIIARLKEVEDPLTKLKRQLQEAKENKDHKLAAKLRKDIWVFQDKLAGQIPPGEDIENVDIYDGYGDDEVIQVVQTSPVKESDVKDEAKSPKDVESHVNTEEVSPENNEVKRKLRKLKKKLQQIEKLKAKQEAGNVLEKTEIIKIENEESLLQEIEELEKVEQE